MTNPLFLNIFFPVSFFLYFTINAKRCLRFYRAAGLKNFQEKGEIFPLSFPTVRVLLSEKSVVNDYNLLHNKYRNV